MTKADLHRLIDGLPDVAVDVAAEFLERATKDPMIVVLDAAPWDDEPYSEEERAEDAEGRAAIARGEGIPWSEVKKGLPADG